jgi:tetratricopeptide (TPR) repeat protein
LERTAIHCLAALARLEGDYARAVTFYTDSLNICRELDDAGGVTVEQLNLGFMTLKQNDIDAAREFFAESLRSAQERKDSYVIAPNLLGLADVAARSGDLDHAARLLGSAESVLEKAGLVWDPDDRLEYDRIVKAISDELGTDRMTVMVAEGRTTSADEAIASALATVTGAQYSGR